MKSAIANMRQTEALASKYINPPPKKKQNKTKKPKKQKKPKNFFTTWSSLSFGENATSSFQNIGLEVYESKKAAWIHAKQFLLIIETRFELVWYLIYCLLDHQEMLMLIKKLQEMVGKEL